MRPTIIGALIALVAPGLVASVQAEEAYPRRLITVVSPLAAGMTGDVLARLYADKLGRRLGQSIAVLNRPGAGGVLAAQSVAVAAPDGYTLLLANSGLTILGTLNRHLPFDPVRDFAGVALVGDAPALVVVPPSLGVHTLREFVELAKAHPGTINYASAGIGSATHLAGAYFAKQAGIDMVHVPYKSSTDIIAGVPYEYATWYGFLAPAKTPEAILQTLNRAISEASTDPVLKTKIADQGITPRDLGLKDFDAHIQRDMNRLAPVLKSVGDQIDN